METMERIKELLLRVLEYMETREDADGGINGDMHPNEEMQIASEIRDILGMQNMVQHSVEDDSIEDSKERNYGVSDDWDENDQFRLDEEVKRIKKMMRKILLTEHWKESREPKGWYPEPYPRSHLGDVWSDPSKYKKWKPDISSDEHKREIDIISKELIDMGFLVPFELDGKMRGQTQMIKTAKLWEIRKAIEKIASEKNISGDVKNQYWEMFW